MNNQFKILYYSSGISNIADGLNLSLLPLIGATLTEKPEEIAFIAMTRTLPWFLLSLHSGNIIDNNKKKTILLIGNLVRSIAFLVLLVLVFTDSIQILSLCILSFIVGSCEVFIDNTTSCLIPKVVNSKNLADANGKIVSLEILTNKFIGVTLGAFLFSKIGASVTSLIIFLLYSIAIISFNFISIKEEESEKQSIPELFKGTFQGFEVILNNKTLKTFMICSAVGNAVYAAFEGILVLYVIDVLLSPKTFYGTAIGALGVGSFIGGRFSKYLFSKVGPKTTYLISTASFPLFFAIIPLFSNVTSLILSLLILGFFFTSTVIITRSFRQKAAKNDLGKVNSVYRLVSWGTQPIAALAGGLVAREYGIINTYYFLAALSSLVFFYALRLKSKSLNVF